MVSGCVQKLDRNKICCGGIAMSLLKFFFFLFFLFLSCSNSYKYEKAIDYFYPLEEGRIYIYRYGEFVIERKIEYVDMKRSIVKVTERVSVESKPGIKGRSIYIYKVKENLIKGTGGLAKGSIILKGPIKIGKSWKVKVYEFDSNLRKKVEYNAKAWIDEIKQIDVLNTQRRCIIVKSYEIIESKRFNTVSIYCKGIGWIGGETPGGKISLIKVE